MLNLSPAMIALSSRPSLLRGAPILSAAAVVAFHLDTGDLRPIQELDEAVEQVLGSGGVLDLGFPKPRGEYHVLAPGVSVPALPRPFPGRVDTSWVARDWPYLPADTDPEFFMTAPEAQRLAGYFQGHERFPVEHRQAVLPDLRLRLFVTLEPCADGPFQELPTHAETLWLFPAPGLGGLLFRGTLALQDPEDPGVLELSALAEPLRGPALTPAECRRILAADPLRLPPEACPAPFLPAPPRGARGPQDLQEVLARLARGQSLRGLDLTGLDGSGQDLAGADFAEAVLDGGTFLGADLRGANFQGAMLHGADFSGARLAGAHLGYASAAEARFRSADLTGADLREGDFSGGDFTRADLTGAWLGRAILARACLKELRGSGLEAGRADFSEADLTQADLSGALMPEADCSDATLDSLQGERLYAPEVRLYGARGAAVALTEAVLTGARAGRGTALPQASLARADLRHSTWEASDLRGADFTGACLEWADFSRSSMQAARLHRVQAQGTRFARADLAGADCSQGNFFRASLRKAKLHRADLSGVNAHGADLFDAALDGARLQGANLSRTILEAAP